MPPCFTSCTSIGSTGKSLEEDVMQVLFFDLIKVMLITSDTQEGFGLDGIQNAERIVHAIWKVFGGGSICGLCGQRSIASGGYRC
jgi:hypothetical protein